MRISKSRPIKIITAQRASRVADGRRSAERKMIAPRSIDSHWQTLGLLCVFVSAPNFAAGIFWDAAFTIVPNSMSLAIFATGILGYVWTHFLSSVCVEKKKLVVQTPLRRREFTLPDDVSVSRTHGGISLVSKRGWPHFVFAPDTYRLSPEQKSIVDQLIAADAQSSQQPIQISEVNKQVEK